MERFCPTCGKSFDKSSVKPTWGLAWGLLWRMWVLLIPFYALLLLIGIKI